MRSSVVALGLLGPWLWAGPAVVAGEQTSPPAEEELLGEAAPAEDLDAIQGLWLRTEHQMIAGPDKGEKMEGIRA